MEDQTVCADHSIVQIWDWNQNRASKSVSHSCQYIDATHAPIHLPHAVHSSAAAMPDPEGLSALLICNRRGNGL